MRLPPGWSQQENPSGLDIHASAEEWNKGPQNKMASQNLATCLALIAAKTIHAGDMQLYSHCDGPSWCGMIAVLQTCICRKVPAGANDSVDFMIRLVQPREMHMLPWLLLNVIAQVVLFCIGRKHFRESNAGTYYQGTFIGHAGH